jgi:hypothetical protein
MKLYKVYIDNKSGQVQSLSATTNNGEIVNAIMYAEFDDPIVIGHYLANNVDDLLTNILDVSAQQISGFNYIEVPVFRSNISTMLVEANKLNAVEFLNSISQKLDESEMQSILNIVFGNEIEIKKPSIAQILKTIDEDQNIETIQNISQTSYTASVADITNLLDKIYDEQLDNIKKSIESNTGSNTASVLEQENVNNYTNLINKEVVDIVTDNIEKEIISQNNLLASKQELAVAAENYNTTSIEYIGTDDNIGMIAVAQPITANQSETIVVTSQTDTFDDGTIVPQTTSPETVIFTSTKFTEPKKLAVTIDDAGNVIELLSECLCKLDTYGKLVINPSCPVHNTVATQIKNYNITPSSTKSVFKQQVRIEPTIVQENISTEQEISLDSLQSISSQPINIATRLAF